MSTQRSLHLNLLFNNAGNFSSAWRWPDSDPRAFIDSNYYVKAAQLCEKGTFDAIFFSDSLALNDSPEFKPFQSLEPTVLLAAIAAHTERIGLIATVSSSYNDPFNIARRFASLDHISGGRTGINIVTTADTAAARNFGQADAYAQGRPVVVQAGGSSDGREVAAKHAEIVFTAAHTLEDAAAYATDLRRRARAFGRADNAIAILPGLVTVIGSTGAEAKRRSDELWELVPLQYGVNRLATVLGLAPSDLSLDKPLPRNIPKPPLGSHTAFEQTVRLAEEKNLTVRELIRVLGGGATMHRVITGTPDKVADSIEAWFLSGHVDGFNVVPDVVASGLEVFVGEVVPLLRKKGIFRSHYEGRTLREHYGLAQPASLYPASAAGREAANATPELPPLKAAA
jgi:alkanesulfonate monooxygenase SsuD/methylene tetrahydromethanopterin reductase-like flavin-dependent oxidoreductase (luciferase family)